MIIVRLIGGLGNQMFQYALGRHLSEIHNTKLKLDISGYETYKYRDTIKYSLWAYNIQESFATEKEISYLKYGRYGLLKRIADRIMKSQRQTLKSYIIEKIKFKFDTEILKLPDNIYLEGSWQNENYFKAIKNILSQEFRVRVPLSGINKRIADEIRRTNSVSLHIRRGAYINDPAASKLHGLCSLEYYKECIDSISEKLLNPHFFVFSDEPQWAHRHLKIKHPVTFVENNNIYKAYEDFRLMTLCRNHIIANSTFSWWAAWLSKYSQKIVFAPKKWFRTVTFDTEALIPEKWIKI